MMKTTPITGLISNPSDNFSEMTSRETAILRIMVIPKLIRSPASGGI